MSTKYKLRDNISQNRREVLDSEGQAVAWIHSEAVGKASALPGLFTIELFQLDKPWKTFV